MLLLRNLLLTGEKFPYDGPDTGSIGSRVRKWTVQEQPCKKKKTN